MDTKRKRLTLDMDESMQRRLKAVAALKGISMRQYCLTAIDKELVKDANDGKSERAFDREAFERRIAHRDALLEGRSLSGDSAALIREAREARNAK